MRVPVKLTDYFKEKFEASLTEFLWASKFIPSPDALQQKRFINRSLAPHVKTLSQLFNRIDDVQTAGIDTESYWTSGANPKNRRLSYLLSFMPPNAFRVASVVAELGRLGFRWKLDPDQEFRGIELGAGVASGACGVLAAAHALPSLSLPNRGSFALIEQSKPALQLGCSWFDHHARSMDFSFSARSFHRRLELTESWLPETAPKFHLAVMSFFLNEFSGKPDEVCTRLIEFCERHLEENGIVIIVEPALKLQSRKLLEFRKLLIQHPNWALSQLKLLLPCLGEQACGALAKEGDWCHEEVHWWRPQFLKELDYATGLDRKSLPFSYLVLSKTTQSINEFLPELSGSSEQRYRLVSPSRSLGKKTSEFYLCGQDGKRRSRYAPPEKTRFERGDILQNAQVRGEHQLTQVDEALLLNPLTDSDPVR